MARPGGVPEWPKGTGCKPVGSAYGGSNPPAPTCNRQSRTGATLRRSALLAQLVEHLHGKEGVNGSSPLEGFTKLLLFSSFSSRTRRRLGAPASTERPPLAATAFCGAWNRCC
jgi:hypothetical protein